MKNATIYEVVLDLESRHLTQGGYVFTNEGIIAQLVEDPQTDGSVAVINTDFYSGDLPGTEIGGAIRK